LGEVFAKQEEAFAKQQAGRDLTACFKAMAVAELVEYPLPTSNAVGEEVQLHSDIIYVAESAMAAVARRPGEDHFAVRVEEEEHYHQADLLRDILGNPFRPVPARFPFLTPDIRELATEIYYRPDFSRLPALAGALERAGCTDIAMLKHCRSLRPHVRGCWVVDLLLGMSYFWRVSGNL
jgi:hypothetical protein